MKEKILSIIKEVANKQKVNITINDATLDREFKTMGIDSINVLGIIVAIEDQLGLKLDDEELSNIKTINQLIAAFEAKQK